MSTAAMIFEHIDVAIAAAEQRVEDLRSFRAQAVALYGAPAAATEAPGPARRTRIKGGSIPARILELLNEEKSLQLPELVKGTKARKHDVKAALDELIGAGRVQRVGKSRGTRYVLPGWRPDGTE